MTDSRELTTREKIGLNIAARRNELDLSQAQLGIAIGRSKDYIQRLEYGRCDLTLKDTEAIVRALKLHDPFVLLGTPPL